MRRCDSTSGCGTASATTTSRTRCRRSSATAARSRRARPAWRGRSAHRVAQHAYPLFERQLAGRTWLASDGFSLADCAALPALFYAAILEPIPAEHTALHAYFERPLLQPSVQRVLEEAKPWFPYFPFAEAMPVRFLQGLVALRTGTRP